MLQWNFYTSPEIKRKHVTVGLTIFKYQFLLSNGKGVRHFLLATHPRKRTKGKRINVNIKRGLSFFRRVIGNLLSKLALCRLRTLIEIPWTTNPINDSDIHSNQALLKHLWRLQPVKCTLLDIVAALLCCILRKINRDGGKMFWLMCQWCFYSLND